MKLSYLMVVNAVVNTIFGIALVLVPESLVAFLGVMAMERVAEQLFGAQLIGFAVLNLFARNAKEGETRRAIVLANLVANMIGFIVTLTIQLSGAWNALGWIVVVIPLLFALGFAYFLLVRPRES